MNFAAALIVATLSAVSFSANAASVCKKGELGGIVVSNVKNKDGSYTTKYKGDKAAFNTPADSKEAIAKVSQLKVGSKNCIVDEGS